MTRTAICGPALAWLLVGFLAAGVAGSETFSFWRVVETLNDIAAIKASIEDPSLICMTGNRTGYNLAEKTAKSLVHLKGLNGTQEQIVTYDYIRSNPDVPNKATLFVNKDYNNPVTVTLGYSDYEACYVGILPFGNRGQCILLVQVEFLANVPQRCSDAFTKVCGAGFSLYSKELCGF